MAKDITDLPSNGDVVASDLLFIGRPTQSAGNQDRKKLLSAFYTEMANIAGLYGLPTWPTTLDNTTRVLNTWSNSTGTVATTSVSAGSITIIETGVYKIEMGWTFSHPTEISYLPELRLDIDGTLTDIDSHTVGSAGEIVRLSGQLYVNLTSDDVLRMNVRSSVVTVNNIVHANAYFTVHPIALKAA